MVLFFPLLFAHSSQLSILGISFVNTFSQLSLIYRFSSIPYIGVVGSTESCGGVIVFRLHTIDLQH